jgi:hypothetical protein
VTDPAERPAARCIPCEVEEMRSPVMRAIARAAWRWEERRQQNNPLTGAARSMAIAMGATIGRQLSHPERHESEYVRTGDPRELARLIRLTN